jgi:uncharacterized membrane protein
VEYLSRVALWRHRLFRLGVLLKGLDGVLELAGGILLVAMGRTGVSRTVALLTQHELSEDPHDLVAGFLMREARQLGQGSVHFAAAYLIAHGLVKLWLVGGLIRERAWVFPMALGFLGLFIAYQLYRLTYQRSLALGVLSAMDLVIMVLVWREYVAVRRAARRSR